MCISDEVNITSLKTFRKCHSSFSVPHDYNAIYFPKHTSSTPIPAHTPQTISNRTTTRAPLVLGFSSPRPLPVAVAVGFPIPPNPERIAPPTPPVLADLSSATVKLPTCNPCDPKETTVPPLNVTAGPAGLRVWVPIAKPDGEAVNVWPARVNIDLIADAELVGGGGGDWRSTAPGVVGRQV